MPGCTQLRVRVFGRIGWRAVLHRLEPYASGQGRRKHKSTEARKHARMSQGGVEIMGRALERDANRHYGTAISSSSTGAVLNADSSGCVWIRYLVLDAGRWTLGAGRWASP